MPAGVPPSVVSTIVAALEKVVRNADITAQLMPLGIVQEWGGAKALADEISTEFRLVNDLLGAVTKTVK